MPDPILELSDIVFDANGLPKYQSLIDPTDPAATALQWEPSLKSDPEVSEQGPFDVVFNLDSGEDASFLVQPGGSFVLRRINGQQVTETGWQAQVSNGGKTCTVQWTESQAPPTQVLRLDCVRDTTQLHLFLVLIDPQNPTSRTTTASAPSPPSGPVPTIQLTREADELIYTIFQNEPRENLGSHQLDLAIRVATGQKVQFEIQLDSSTGCSFPAGGTGTDEVPVSIYPGSASAGNAPALEPTLRPSPTECVVTWLQNASQPGPPDHFLSFNLTMTIQKELIRRIDPTVIEDPFAPPPGPPLPEDVERGQ